MLSRVTKKIAKIYERIAKDMQRPNGKFANLLRDTVRDTADYFSRLVENDGMFNSKTGRTIRAFKNSWEFNYNGESYLVNIDKANRLAGPIKRSPYNHTRYIIKGREVTSPWMFLIYGWGKRGGGKSPNSEKKTYTRTINGEEKTYTKTIGYPLKVLVRRSRGVYSWTSPYNPDIENGVLSVKKIVRHPGRKARNWFIMYEQQYNAYFRTTFTTRFEQYLNDFGLYV